MTATEQWIFLCAAHKTPKECPAIDYTRHTLDGAACLLNSNKYFPSRFVLIIYVLDSEVGLVRQAGRKTQTRCTIYLVVITVTPFEYSHYSVSANPPHSPRLLHYSIIMS